MAENKEQGNWGAAGRAQMPPTLWTTVLAARDLHSRDSETALATLCEIYWFPLYAFVRRQGYDHHRAQDLTQAFFEHLLSREWLAGVGKEKGRFRSFLLCALSNYLNGAREKDHAQKRGGGPQQFVSWDAEAGEGRLNLEASSQYDPLTEFDRRWAAALVERSLSLLRDEYTRCGKSPLFNVLSPFMTRPVTAGFYAQAAAEFRTSEGALRISMHRLLQRFGELLRAEVAHTVADPASAEDELREVLKAWATTA
jgi:DNA-directed RNA polymerase specialized sigma24 family protein